MKPLRSSQWLNVQEISGLDNLALWKDLSSIEGYSKKRNLYVVSSDMRSTFSSSRAKQLKRKETPPLTSLNITEDVCVRQPSFPLPVPFCWGYLFQVVVCNWSLPAPRAAVPQCLLLSCLVLCLVCRLVAGSAFWSCLMSRRRPLEVFNSLVSFSRAYERERDKEGWWWGEYNKGECVRLSVSL